MAVAAIAVLLGVTVGALLLASVASAAKQVANAADQAALAAAQRHWGGGAGDACAQAASVAAANGATLTGCRIEDSGVVVTAERPLQVPGLLAGFGPARSTARAGPELR